MLTVLLVGLDLTQLLRVAKQMTGVAVVLLTNPEPRTERQMRAIDSVVVVVKEDDVDTQALWQSWLKRYVFGKGKPISWSVY